MTEIRHQPVMPVEVIKYLNPQPGEIVIDGTLGLGGHACLIADLLGNTGVLVGIDQDETALQIAQRNLASFQGKLILHHGNFKQMASILQENSMQKVDGIFLDLGVSSIQLDLGERGFSYQQKAPLDMRMNLAQKFTAADLVNTFSLEELIRVIRDYGEERWASRIAHFIVEERKKAPIVTTEQLVSVIKAAIPAGARKGGPHPARRTFQAIRIAVNQELEGLQEGLVQGIDCLRPGGRLAIISFHSLEDRMVKKTFKEKSQACQCPTGLPICRCGGKQELKILTSRPIIPTTEEIMDNPRSRSAKLRAAYKLV
ncbi:MAG TPA: 16S rRNA (cytosine(1402)-N(4))-methyltransferase [Firmicutes bacterium]|nr:16S rRNA (cytosine(1402)-N(4))-methyltransferase [Bacillota bacterium]